MMLYVMILYDVIWYMIWNWYDVVLWYDVWYIYGFDTTWYYDMIYNMEFIQYGMIIYAAICYDIICCDTI